MWFLHETHEVVGSREDEFEAAVRDEWMPAVAGEADARLLYFLKHAHGTGASYRVITITALRDAAAWEGLAHSVDGGALGKLAERLDGLRHDVVSKIMLPLPWSETQEVDLERVPTTPTEHELTVFMEDTMWPFEGLLERYVERAGAHYAREMADHERAENAILQVLGGFRTAFGSHRRREIVLWQKVVEPRALLPLITREVPEIYRRPGTWMKDALDVRDQWESRLLRTTSWSPLY